MAKTKAAIEATRRYEQKNNDRVLILFPKGTKDRIRATGASVNGFTVQAVLKALDAIDNKSLGE